MGQLFGAIEMSGAVRHPRWDRPLASDDVQRAVGRIGSECTRHRAPCPGLPVRGRRVGSSCRHEFGREMYAWGGGDDRPGVIRQYGAATTFDVTCWVPTVAESTSRMGCSRSPCVRHHWHLGVDPTAERTWLARQEQCLRCRSSSGPDRPCRRVHSACIQERNVGAIAHTARSTQIVLPHVPDL